MPFFTSEIVFLQVSLKQSEKAYAAQNLSQDICIPYGLWMKLRCSAHSGTDTAGMLSVYFLCIRQSGWEKQRNTAFLYF